MSQQSVQNVYMRMALQATPRGKQRATDQALRSWGAGPQSPQGKGSPMTWPRHSWGGGQRRPVAIAWGRSRLRGQEPHLLGSNGRLWGPGACGLHMVWAVVQGSCS